MPAAASALCRLPAEGDDPVFAAIEAHRQAFEAHKSAEEMSARAYAEWDEQHDGRGLYLGEYPEITYRFTGQFVGRIPEVKDVHTGRMVARYAINAVTKAWKEMKALRGQPKVVQLAGMH